MLPNASVKRSTPNTRLDRAPSPSAAAKDTPVIHKTYFRGADADEDAPSPGGPAQCGRGGSAHQALDMSFPIDSTLIFHNLWLFIWLKTIGSFDSGAFSGALGAENGIAESWELSATQQGTLASTVFLGNVLGCPLSGYLFSNYDEKQMLVWSNIIHTVFTFLFAAFPVYWVALVNRFFIGLTLSFVVVYTPIWVDEFAPRDRQSVWMASHNAGVPVGVMFGYILGMFFSAYLPQLGWNWAFYLKCVLMVPTIVYMMKADSRSINTKKAPGGGERMGSAFIGVDDNAGEEMREVRGDGPDGGASGRRSVTSPTPSTSGAAMASASSGSPLTSLTTAKDFARYKFLMIRSSFQPIFANTVYLCSVFTMTSLYFVATGLQNFVTQYLRGDPFNASTKTIMIGFGSAVVSAPVLGVIVGGVLLDRFGGYQRNLKRAALFIMFWGGLAALFSIICIFLTTTRSFLLLMSVVLFCGGAIIPPGAGLTMASLPSHLRSSGAAFSQTMYNLLGNFSGPMVCGFVTKQTGSLRYGIMTLLLCSGLGMIPAFIMLMVALRAPASDLGPSTVVVVSGDNFGADPSGPEEGEDCGPDGKNYLQEGLRTAAVAGEDGTTSGARSSLTEVGLPSFATRNYIQESRLCTNRQREEELAHPVVRGPGMATPTPWDSATGRPRSPSMLASHTSSTILSPSQRQWDRSADLELMQQEAGAAAVMSLPDSHSLGMDIVRSWLHTQNRAPDGPEVRSPSAARQTQPPPSNE